MAKYYFTSKAVEDITEIWNYSSEEWSESQADQYYQMLISVCDTISNYPGIGKSYEFIAERLFGMNSNKHIIFYRKIDEVTVEITRILHESMDLKNRYID